MTIFEIMRQYEGQYISIDVYEQRNEKAFPWDADINHGFEINHLIWCDDEYEPNDTVKNYRLMSKSDYLNTIMENSNLTEEDLDDKDFPILVIVREEQKQI